MSDKQTEKTIQLDTPIKRGKTEITEIVLRKPQSGALRGTRLQAIMDMDVNAMMTVIPRISSPAQRWTRQISLPCRLRLSLFC